MLSSLFMLHAVARGTFAQNAATARTVFTVEEGIKPFDTDRIKANFMV